MWIDVAVGILGNFATAVIAVVVGFLFLAARRRALLRFWGLDERKKIRIYVSHLRIAMGGALGADGTPRSYQGSVVTLLESEMAELLRSLFFASLPGASVLPNWTRALSLVDADVAVEPSPLAVGQIEPDGSIVTFGSPGYNVVSGVVEQNCPNGVRFTPGNGAIQLPGNITTNSSCQGFVMRVRAGGRFWFYAAGLAEGGTAAAGYYLATSWRRLDRRFRESPSFYVMLEVVGHDFRHVRVIAEGALDSPPEP